MALALASCGDDGNAPVVTITSPSNDSSFTASDTFNLVFSVTDDIDIATITVNSDGLATGEVPASELSGSADTDFSGSFSVPTVGANTGDYTVTLTATDNEGNAGSDEISITIN